MCVNARISTVIRELNRRKIRRDHFNRWEQRHRENGRKKEIEASTKIRFGLKRSLNYYEKNDGKNHGDSSQLFILLSEHPPYHLQHQMLLFCDLLVNGFYKNLKTYWGGALPNQVNPISEPMFTLPDR